MTVDSTIASIYGVEKTANKDAVSGYAGLDAHGHQVGNENFNFYEEYSNHLGAVDNYTQTAVTGGSTATTDTVNHLMALTCGTNVGDYAIWSTKETWRTDSYAKIANFILTPVGDSGSSTNSLFGFIDSATYNSEGAYGVYFYASATFSGVFLYMIGKGAGGSYVLAPGKNFGKKLYTIILYDTYAEFYKDGVYYGTADFTGYGVNTLDMFVGARVWKHSTPPATQITLNVDYMGLKINKI